MSRDDFDIFFDVLETLHDQALAMRAKILPDVGVKNLFINNSPQDAPKMLRGHYNSSSSGRNVIVLLARLPYPKASISACGLLPTVLGRDPFSVQIDIVLAKGKEKPFIMRFDCAHPSGDHQYFHSQLSETLTPERKSPISFIGGFGGSVPAVPVPAKDAIELLMSSFISLYGPSLKKIDLSNLNKKVLTRIAKARRNVNSRCNL